MDDDNSYLPGFLVHLGIKAEVRRDMDARALIVIETRLFDQHRNLFETWFKLVEQRGNYSYFHERVRGSGDTGKLG